MLKLILWTLLWLVMWFWAIVGPLYMVMAAVSFFVDISPYVSLTLFNNEPVQTPIEKAAYLAMGAFFGTIGIGFLVMRRFGYFKDPV